MPSRRASSNSCNISNEMPTYIGSNSADESLVWKDKGYGRLPASRTKTWWRSVVQKTQCDSSSNSRKPRQLARMVKGWGTAGRKHFRDFVKEEEYDLYEPRWGFILQPIDAPIAREDGVRLAKCIGAKADKRNIKWHKAVKLDQKMWPHGYKGRKPHKEDYADDVDNFMDDEAAEEDAEEDYMDDVNISTDNEDAEDNTAPPADTLFGLTTRIGFPELCTTTPASFKMRADQWRRARAIALNPLRVAARIAKDTSEAAAIAHELYTKAAAAARKADAELEYRYRRRHFSIPMRYSVTWQYARDKALEAANDADKWAQTMLAARAKAEAAQRKHYELVKANFLLNPNNCPHCNCQFVNCECVKKN